ncbi:MAG: diguanylate cyclase [Spirochaetales bacterium]|nr:diguanylate cyclase [Spirochaetales bacterium]
MERKNRRPTIGFLTTQLFDEYSVTIWSAVVAEAEKHDINVACFIGGSIKAELYLEYQRNPIYDLINKKKIDGLILLSNQIFQYTGINELKNFIQKFSPLPIVNIGVDIENSPCILVDNKTGMKKLLVHLIEVHGYKDIAFICGPQNSQESALRYEAYKEVLREYNIDFNKDLIIDGDFQDGAYAKGFSEFFSKKLKYDAIVASNDYMAIRIMNDIKKLNLKIPDDVAVTGFDYNESSRTVFPKLTTVSQPKYDIGITAFKTLLSLINNESVPEKQILPTKVIIQQSCGCSRIFEYAIYNKQTKKLIKKHLSSPEEKKSIINAIENEIEVHCVSLISKEKRIKWAKDLIEATLTSIKEKSDSRFFDRLQNIILQGIHEGMDVYGWYKIISKVFSTLYDYINTSERRYLEKLYSTSLVSIGEMIDHLKLDIKVSYRNQILVLYQVNERLISIFDINILINTLSEVFPKLGINSYYMCAYTDTYDKRKDAKLLFYKNENNTIPDVFKTGKADELLANILAKIEKRFSFLVMALFYKDIQIGFVIFEIGFMDGAIYESLSVQISSALRSIELINEIKQYSEELEIKVKERTINLEKAKEELEQANQKLRELDVLKNDFIANITHDFRSPLTAILNTTDLALKFDKQSPEENQENYNTIYSASLRLRKSIDRLLDLAKIDAHGITLNVSRVNIISLLNSVINFYSSSVVGSGIKILRKLPDYEIKNLYTDIEKFDEVIHNIMSNAIKFVDPEKGVITVELTEQKNTIRIRVTDNGIGIAKDKLRVIFNRFEQAHNSGNIKVFRGTGIGLSYAKQLIEYMKGRIWAESEGEGKGAQFIIELKKGRDIFNEKDFLRVEPPLKKYKEEKVIIEYDLQKKLERQEIVINFRELNKENEFNYKKAKILIIDDDTSIRKIVMNYLINYDYVNFILATDGKQGLDAVYEYSPDLILCDFNMPHMKGDKFHDEILNNPKFRYIPFIFLSAIADDKIMIERREKGASAYLTKPIDEKDLLLTVEQHLKQYFEYLKIFQLAMIDELTGLYTRRVIFNNLSHELSVRRYRDVSVIFFDIDSFKIHNDTFDHQAGDKILTTVGKLVTSSIRQYDQAGRYGGDEFLIILPDTNLKQALIVAQTLKEKIKKYDIKYEKRKIAMSASFGVASLKDNAQYICDMLKIDTLKSIYEIKKPADVDWERIGKYKIEIGSLLIKMADIALYKAKSVICKNCGFCCEKANSLENITCPKCHGNTLILGGDRVVAFSG